MKPVARGSSLAGHLPNTLYLLTVDSTFFILLFR
jgi:hypothetical protein